MCSLNSGGLCAVIISLRRSVQVTGHPRSEKPFPDVPSEPFFNAAWYQSLGSCHWHQREEVRTIPSSAVLEEVVTCQELTPHYCLLQAKEAKVNLAAAAKLCPQDLSPSWPLFSGHILMVWCSSYIEVYKTLKSAWPRFLEKNFGP